MSDVLSAAVAKLKATAGVSALVAARIAVDTAPPSWALPMVLLSRVSTVPVNQLTGNPSDFQSRLQVDAYATTRVAAGSLADAIAAALREWRDLVGTPNIHSAKELLRHDFTELDEDGTGEPVAYRTSIDFSVWHA